MVVISIGLSFSPPNNRGYRCILYFYIIVVDAVRHSDDGWLWSGVVWFEKYIYRCDVIINVREKKNYKRVAFTYINIHDVSKLDQKKKNEQTPGSYSDFKTEQIFPFVETPAPRGSRVMGVLMLQPMSAPRRVAPRPPEAPIGWRRQ